MASSLQSLLDTGSQMLRNQQFAEAQNHAAAMLQQYPGNPLALLFAADAADALGDPTGALRYIEAVPPGSPHHAQVALRKAQLLFGIAPSHRCARGRIVCGDAQRGPGADCSARASADRVVRTPKARASGC